MTVRDLLRSKHRDLITTTASSKVHMAMALLIRNQVSCLPVLNEAGELAGIISDKDIFRGAYENRHGFADMTVGELMTSEVIVGLETDDIGYIASIMTNNRIRHVPIVDGTRLVGLVSVGDIVKTQMSDIEVENRYLWQYINGTYPA